MPKSLYPLIKKLLNAPRNMQGVITEALQTESRIQEPQKMKIFKNKKNSRL